MVFAELVVVPVVEVLRMHAEQQRQVAEHHQALGERPDTDQIAASCSERRFAGVAMADVHSRSTCPSKDRSLASQRPFTHRYAVLPRGCPEATQTGSRLTTIPF